MFTALAGSLTQKLKDLVASYLAEMGGHENEGALCINCFEPPEDEATMTELKSKF